MNTDTHDTHDTTGIIDTRYIDRFVATMRRSDSGRDRGWRQRVGAHRTSQRLVGQLLRKAGRVQEELGDAQHKGYTLLVDALDHQHRALIEFPVHLAGTNLKPGQRHALLRKAVRAL